MDGRVSKLLLTPEEAADALAIGRTKVYELMRPGQLRSVRVGTCRRVPEVALREFVARLLADGERDEGARRAWPAAMDWTAGTHPDETPSAARAALNERPGPAVRTDVARPRYRSPRPSANLSGEGR